MLFKRGEPIVARESVPKPKAEGCKMRFKRDKTGNIVSIETNGKCSRAEIELAKGNTPESAQED